MVNSKSSIWDGRMKFILTLLLICNIAVAKDFDTTPKIIEAIDTPKDYKTVIYDKRYSFAIPEKYDVKRADTGYLFIVTPENKGLVGVYETPTFNKPEDYGLNITRRELISAFYDPTYIDNKDVIATRKEIFKSSTNITVYKRDGFIFFRRFTNEEPFITISSPVNDDIIKVGFSTDNEELIMNFIKSFRVK